MRVWGIFAIVLAGVTPVAAADLLQPYAPKGEFVGGAVAGGSVAIVAEAYPAPPLYVVAPPRVRLVAPRHRPLNYAPPPVYPSPPPLIAALPVIGPYLVPVPLGAPPASALDAYDHRFDYNQ